MVGRICTDFSRFAGKNQKLVMKRISGACAPADFGTR